MIEVGSQVVCIRDDWYRSPAGLVLPRAGVIYTVRGINDQIRDAGFGLGLLGLVFEEIINSPGFPMPGRGEVHFDARCFRPVRRTDISQFRELLNPVTPHRLETV